MSPNVGNFVHDLVEMAKAMETLPQVQAECDRLAKALDDALGTVQALELRAVDRKAEIANLNDRIRSLEVERDDASFRVLEAEERTEKLERCFQSALEAMDATDRLIQSFKPVPMPEPVKEPEPVATQAEGQSEVSPTSTTNLQSSGEDVGKLPNAVHSTQDTTTGQSVENPSAPNQDGDGSHIGDASTMIAEKQSDAAPSPTEPSRGPYFGKRYMDIPQIIDIHAWLEGGGTEGDYYWRLPSPKVGDRSW